MMSSVYGSFIEHFSELMETFNVWTFPDKSDIRTVRAVLMPNKGSSIKRRKYTSGNTGLDIVDSDDFYIGRKYYEHVKTGDYISKVSDNIIMMYVGWWKKHGNPNWILKSGISDMGGQVTYNDNWVTINKL